LDKAFESDFAKSFHAHRPGVLRESRKVRKEKERILAVFAALRGKKHKI
jgi:hypothetical protein